MILMVMVVIEMMVVIFVNDLDDVLQKTMAEKNLVIPHRAKKGIVRYIIDIISH